MEASLLVTTTCYYIVEYPLITYTHTIIKRHVWSIDASFYSYILSIMFFHYPAFVCMSHCVRSVKYSGTKYNDTSVSYTHFTDSCAVILVTQIYMFFIKVWSNLQYISFHHSLANVMYTLCRVSGGSFIVIMV